MLNNTKLSEFQLNKVVGGFDIEKALWDSFGYETGWRSKWNLSHPYFKI